VTAVMACRSELELGGTTWGAWRVPWADGRVSWMAAPSGLKLVARRTARRMEAANGAKKRAAASQLEARRASLIWNEMQLTICSRASASRMEEGCFKSALSNTLRCSAHGGGRRCQHEGCFKAAQGGKLHCIAHGGGKRCQDDGCCKSALGNTSHCVAHGGGKRCQEDSCCKSAAGGGTPYCVAHGGGKRCRFAGCTKAAQGGTEGGMLYCVAHGVGKACEMPGCPKTKHSDWPSRRRQAVRGGRLPHRAGQGARPTAGHTGGASGARVWAPRAGSAATSRCPGASRPAVGHTGGASSTTSVWAPRPAHAVQYAGPSCARSTPVSRGRSRLREGSRTR
jgi:hypothetical protein